MGRKELCRLFCTVVTPAITAALLILSACEALSTNEAVTKRLTYKSRQVDYKKQQENPVVPEVDLSLEGIDLEVFTTDPRTPAAEHHLKYTKNEYVVELDFPTEKIRLRANPKAADDVVINYILDDFTMKRSSDLREGSDGYVEVSMLVYFDVKVQVEVHSGQRFERTTIFLRRHFPEAVLYVDEVNGHDIPDMAAGLSLKAAYKTLNYAFRRLVEREEKISTVVVYHTLTMDSQTNDESVFLINNVGSTEGGKRRILVMGLDASEPGELKATGTGKRVLTVTGDNIRITFMHMKFTGADTSAKDGAGIFVGPGAEVTLGSGTEVRNNTGRNGGGVYVSNNGTLTMQGGSVQSNYANQNGAGVYVSSGATLVMKEQGSVTANGGNGIAQVATVRGGGIYAASGSTMTLEQSVLVAQNVAQVAGGGIYIEGKFAPAAVSAWSDVSIEYNHLISNVGEGVGLHLGGDAEVRFASNVRIASNYAQEGGSAGFSKGGGIMLSDSAHLTIDSQVMPERQNWITGNKAASGGGVYLRGSAVFDNGAIIGRTSQANTALVSGGGIYIESGAINFMDNAAVNGNTAADEGGGIYSGISAITFAGNNIQVNDNHAQNGGGVFFAHGTVTISGDSMSIMRNTAKQQGGGIYSDVGAITFAGKYIQVNDNLAENGGGMFFARGTATISGDSMSIMRNTAKQQGGGIYSDIGAITFAGKYMQVNDNQAQNGGGMFFYHGSATISGDSMSIMRNTAKQQGGGIYSDIGAITFIPPAAGKYIQVSNNTASNSGGGVYMSGGALTLNTGSKINNNNATLFGGGVYVAGGTVTLNTGAAMEGNAVGTNHGRGGGIYMEGGTVTQNGASVKSNTAARGGGFFQAAGSLTLNGPVFANTAIEGGNFMDLDGVTRHAFTYGDDVYVAPEAVLTLFNTTGSMDIFLERGTAAQNGAQIRAGNDLSAVKYNLVPTEHVFGIRVLVNEANTTKYYKSFRLPLTDPNDNFGWVVNSRGLIHETGIYSLTAMNNNDIPLITKDSRFWVEDFVYHVTQNTSIVTDAEWNTLPDGPVYIGVKRNPVNGTISYYVTTILNVNKWSDSLGYFRPAENDRVLFALYKKNWNSTGYYVFRTPLTKPRIVPTWDTRSTNGAVAGPVVQWPGLERVTWMIANLAGGRGGNGGMRDKGTTGNEYSAGTNGSTGRGYNRYYQLDTSQTLVFYMGGRGSDGDDGGSDWGGAGGGGGGGDTFIKPTSGSVWVVATGGRGGNGSNGDTSSTGQGGGGGGGSGGSSDLMKGYRGNNGRTGALSRIGFGGGGGGGYGGGSTGGDYQGGQGAVGVSSGDYVAAGGGGGGGGSYEYNGHNDNGRNGGSGGNSGTPGVLDSLSGSGGGGHSMHAGGGGGGGVSGISAAGAARYTGSNDNSGAGYVNVFEVWMTY